MDEKRVPCCPFCGGKFRIIVCDYIGNIKEDPDKYLKNPWSGLSFAIQHEEQDVPDGVKCPIASHEGDNSTQGIWLYDTQDDAIDALMIRPPQKPLTLEEALASDHVYLQNLDKPFMDEEYPVLLEDQPETEFVAYWRYGIGALNRFVRRSEYGKRWICWANKPEKK